MRKVWLACTVFLAAAMMNGCSKCSREEVPPPPSAPAENPADSGAAAPSDDQMGTPAPEATEPAPATPATPDEDAPAPNGQ